MIHPIGQIRLQTLLLVALGLPFFAGLIVNLTGAFQQFNSFLDVPKVDPKRRELLRILQRIGNLPTPRKKETLLFIPQSNEIYWHWYDNCIANPFIAPAITGIAMLDGLPSAECQARNYGYSAYELRSPDQPTLQASDTTHICEAAQRRGFAKVIVLDVDQKQNFKLQSLDCSK